MQGQFTTAATTADPNILNDWSTPFDDFKVQVLDNVVNVMYSGGSTQNVSLLSLSLSQNSYLSLLI